MAMHVHAAWSAQNVFKEWVWNIGFGQAQEPNQDLFFSGIFVAAASPPETARNIILVSNIYVLFLKCGNMRCS
jgi:hypothetical protein